MDCMDKKELDAAKAYEQLFVPALFDRWARIVADQADFRPGDRVLDVACGTGATLAGYISAAPASSRLLGVAALKNAGFLNDDVQQLLNSQSVQRSNWNIALDYHFGGFAKTTPALQEFMRQFSARHSIALDNVYTGKLLYAIYDLIQKGYFKSGERIVVCHTGGLQGNRSSPLIIPFPPHSQATKDTRNLMEL